VRRANPAVVFLTCVLALLALPAFAEGRVECAAVNSRVMAHPIRYCALLPASFATDPARRFPVLYFLHGLGENEQTFVDGGGWSLVENMRAAGMLGDFVIIAPDGDSTFFIDSRDGKRPYEDFFIREFMPAVERRYRIRASRGSRGITGISMGGYGALHLAFRHPQLFAVVSAHSAALIQKFPSVLLKGTIANPMVRVMNQAFGTPFDMRFWNANSPLEMAQRDPGLNMLHIYFDCGSGDDFGFDAGASALDKILTARHIAHEFHLYSGAHDWAYVAQHMPASLQFQWHALSSTH
jgi:S-formylglutathione hydrolase FrmB